MYVILGATGNTGSVVAEKLLAKREKVRAVGRNKERLATLAKRGAETIEKRYFRFGFSCARVRWSSGRLFHGAAARD